MFLSSSCTVTYLYRIKNRVKSKACDVLPVDTTGCSILNASWPGECDTREYGFEVSFKLPKVTTSIIDVDDMPEPFGQVACGTRLCATCWACPCGACQHLATWAAWKEGELSEEQERVMEAMCLLGDQQQVIDEHWDLSSKGVVGNLTKIKKKKKSWKTKMRTKRHKWSN